MSSEKSSESKSVLGRIGTFLFGEKDDLFSLETVKLVLSVVVIAVAIRSLAYEPFNIPSSSMKPTLLIGDYLFVSKLSYGYSRYSFPFALVPISGRVFNDAPERGDVAVFRKPTDPSVDFIKRIVGLPGERIRVTAGVLHINDQPVKRRRIEDYLLTENNRRPRRVAQYLETLPNGVQHRILETDGDGGFLDNTPEFVVPDGHYFMMGDNRDNSTDSRRPSVGFVPIENFIGRAEIIFFSRDGWKIRFDRLFTLID